MFDQQHYVPILKWRQGEYLALERSKDSIKNWITPFFEIPLEQWDFEKEEPAKSLDEHLKNFGKRLKKSWGERRCFVDSPFLDGSAVMDDSTHHLSRIFALARANNCKAVPVFGLSKSDEYLTAVADIVSEDSRGACVRLTPEDFEAPLATSLQKLLAKLKIAPEDVDVIIDSAEDVLASATAQAASWQASITALPQLMRWRSLTIAGGTFPDSLAPADDYRPYKDVKRREWLAYKKLVNLAAKRIPAFGDYSCSATRTANIDPRLFDPNAKIKYTINDHWRVVVGRQVKRNGRGQYQELCKRLIASTPKAYEGPKYSWGDEFIKKCADGEGNGGSSTWPCVATNHHSAKVVRDVAKLFGSSSMP